MGRVRFYTFLLMTLFLPIKGKAQVDSIAPKQPLQIFNVSTNLIHVAVLAPNIGAELRFDKNVTLAAHVGSNWYSASPLYNHIRFVTADVEARYWLFTQPADVMRRGHHVGVYGALYRYDFYFGHKGDQADLNWGGGISYGYTVSLSRLFSLDFTLGIGYVGGQYKKYEHIDDAYQHDVWMADKIRHYVGPSKAEVSFIWHLF